LNSAKRKVQGQSGGKAGRKRRGGDDGTIGRRHYIIAQILFPKFYYLEKEEIQCVLNFQSLLLFVCMFIQQRTSLAIKIVPTMHSTLFILNGHHLINFFRSIK
jgi:hypothetical protein